MILNIKEAFVMQPVKNYIIFLIHLYYIVEKDVILVQVELMMNNYDYKHNRCVNNT